jgi:predicted nucleic acid-binding protein
VILLDTDILIDVALDRVPHSDAASQLLAFLEQAPKMAFVAWHSLSNFYYLVRSARGDADTRQFLRDLTSFVLVAPTQTEDCHFATGLSMRDFEDAMQVAAAYACGAETIVTRNTRDYRDAPISARTPLDALALIR